MKKEDKDNKYKNRTINISRAKGTSIITLTKGTERTTRTKNTSKATKTN